MLTQAFYTNKNTIDVAKNLLGKILVTKMEGLVTKARIVETEAYCGITDKACHAYNNKRTKRTEIMFANGGVCYIYLCYGMHYLFNVVTNTINNPHAVLVRAVEPLEGLEIMQKRTGKKENDFTITKGPGNVTKALGITNNQNGYSLLQNTIYIEEDDFVLSPKQIINTPRIGVHYAKEDALLLYRFFIKNNLFVSGKKIDNFAN